MYKLGMIVRMDDTGLGNQTRALCKMLKPHKLLVVTSSSFNGDVQHPEWYSEYECIFTDSWPSDQECNRFMFGLTHMLTAETVYNNHIFWLAKRYKVKIFIQPNWEFLDHLMRPLPQPTKWFMPSYWHLDDMHKLFPNTVYLPPPMFLDDFSDNRLENMKHRKKRNFLHVVGKRAAHDRNGTNDLLNALNHTSSEFMLTIRAQHDDGSLEALSNDGRVKIEYGNLDNEHDLYKGYDAMILPRRYAGLCLPLNESLSSALPVIMPDISPNNKLLPHNWLVRADVTDKFQARTSIDVYTSDPLMLASKMDEFATMSAEELKKEKAVAFEIAEREFSHISLLERYKYNLGIS